MANLFNNRNNGTAIGRLARDPKVFTNSDGSKRVKFTVMADRKRSELSDGVPVEAFIRPETDVASTPFGHMHEGDLVEVDYSVKDNNYTDKATGEKHYGIRLEAEFVDLLESKAVTQARYAQKKAERDAQVNQAAATNQAVAEDLAPAAPTQPQTQAPVEQVPAQEPLPFG